MLNVTALYGVLSQKSRGEKTKAYSKMAVQQQDAHFIKNQADVRCHVRYHKVYLYCHTAINCNLGFTNSFKTKFNTNAVQG